MGDGDDEPVIDPGWRDAWAGVLWMPTMFLLQRRLRTSTLPTLLLVRRVLVMFATAGLGFGAILAALGSRHTAWSSGSALRLGGVVLVGGLLLQLVARRFLTPPIPCGEPKAVAAAYRVRFFFRAVIANAIAYVGFTLSFITGRWWVYLFGLAAAAVGMGVAAPTRAAVEREWRDLVERGCEVNLLAALMQPRPSSR